MKTIALTAVQQSEITSLKAALATAQATAVPYNKAIAVANTALNAYINSIAGVPAEFRSVSPRFGKSIQLTDDGTAIVSQ